jgi:hypothetical protein
LSGLNLARAGFGNKSPLPPILSRIDRVIIIAAGIYIFMRERKEAKEMSLMEPP